jgi:hypothetical protein
VKTFYEAVKHAIDIIPDTDGEPGYYAHVTDWGENEEHLSALAEIVDPDAENEGEKFIITITRFTP